MLNIYVIEFNCIKNIVNTCRRPCCGVSCKCRFCIIYIPRKFCHALILRIFLSRDTTFCIFYTERQYKTIKGVTRHSYPLDVTVPSDTCDKRTRIADVILPLVKEELNHQSVPDPSYEYQNHYQYQYPSYCFAQKVQVQHLVHNYLDSE